MKSQVFSLDFIVAVFVFILLFTVGLRWWDSTTNTLSESIISSSIEHKADALLQLLITTKGVPYNWDLDAIQYGLATEMYTLDKNKVEMFVDYSMDNYDIIRKNLGIADYEFNFKIKSSTGELLYDTGRFPPYVREVVRIVRVARLDDNPVEVELLVWIK